MNETGHLVTIHVTPLIYDYLYSRFGAKINFVNKGLIDDYELIALRDRILHIAGNSKVLRYDRNKLYKKYSKTYQILLPVKYINPSQNNKIVNEIWDWFKKEFYFELAVSLDPCLSNKIRTFITKYKLEDSADTINLYCLLDWKKKKKVYLQELTTA